MVAVVFWPVVPAEQWSYCVVGRSRVTRWPSWAFSSWFFSCRCATTGAGVSFRLSGVIMRQYTEAFGRISGLHARVVRTWKFGALFRSGLVSDSYLFFVWVLPCGVQCNWILREMTLPRAQHLVRQWIHVMLQYTWLLDDFPTISTSTWTRNLWCFFSVLTQNGQVCSVDASGYCPCMRCLHTHPEFLRAARGWQFA